MNIRKEELRRIVWEKMEREKIATFPKPVDGRIPNFIGALEASKRVIDLQLWRKARIIKSNPDSPQKYLRELALRQGKTVYMAVPRLRSERCFLEIKPGADPSKASTIKGAFKHGEQVGPWEMKRVDLIISGSVAVDRYGGRIGKSGGYSDLEYAIGREYGIVSEHTPVLTTVHPVQIVSEIPMQEHDVPVDYIVTTEEAIKILNPRKKPDGIYWSLLEKEKIDSIPILKKLAQEIRTYQV
jgi:5-formyltetrahydrofolate cyclo-ligase